jgi:hypothetical protein
MTYLPREAQNEVIAWKNKGGKVSLLLPEFPAAQPGCANCRGVGSLHLSFIVGGPYDVPKSAVNKNGDGTVRSVFTAANVGGRWYKQKTKAFQCSACHGTGEATGRLLQSKELAL